MRYRAPFVTLLLLVAVASGCDTAPEPLEPPADELHALLDEAELRYGDEALEALATIAPEDLEAVRQQLEGSPDGELVAATFAEDGFEPMLTSEQSTSAWGECPAWRCANAWSLAVWECSQYPGGYLQSFSWNERLCAGWWWCGIDHDEPI